MTICEHPGIRGCSASDIKRAHLVRVGSKRNPESPSETEIGNLEIPRFVDQEILRFHISMEDPSGVEMRETEKELREEFLSTYCRELFVAIRVVYTLKRSRRTYGD